jgi:hypothetical protein
MTQSSVGPLLSQASSSRLLQPLSAAQVGAAGAVWWIQDDTSKVSDVHRA